MNIRTISSQGAVLALLVFGVTTPSSANAIGQCGPGANWVNTCTAGRLTFNNWTLTGTVGSGPGSVTVVLTGTGVVDRLAPSGGSEALKLVSLDLTGSGFHLFLNPAHRGL